MSPARRSAQRKRKPAAKPPKIETPVELVAGDRSAKLGTKHACFSCGAKFYDLNKPEPICPKCETDQRQKPAETQSKASPDPPRKARRRPMALLDDDEESAAPFGETEVELDIGKLQSGEKLFDDEAEEESSEEESD